MEERTRVMFILRDFDPKLRPVEKALKEVASMTGFSGETSEDQDGGIVIEDIITGIDGADLVVADLTHSNANVFYELGVAHALNKSCLTICQKRGAEWVVSREGSGLGRLRFDVSNVRVKGYTNDTQGLQLLKTELTKDIKGRKGAPISNPVNNALTRTLERYRSASYLLWGVVGGSIIALFASLLRAITGETFISAWRPGFVRAVFEAGQAGFFGGGFAFLAYSIVYNLQKSRPSRVPILVGQTIAGFLGGLAVFIPTYFINSPVFGGGVALGMGLPFLIELTFGGVAFGWALNIQPPLADREPLGVYVKNMVLYFFLIYGLFIGFMYIFDERILPSAYLERYSMSQTVVEAVAAALTGIGLSALHWWLKWVKKL